jgi:hypothetical protein
MKSTCVFDDMRGLGICLMAVFCMLLVACGGGGSSSASSATPAPPAPVVVPVVPAPAPVVQAKPTLPIPAALWRAPPDALPKTGNYIYFSSEMGAIVPDFVGAGKTYVYSAEQKNDMYVRFVEGRIDVTVLNDYANYYWLGQMRPMNGLTPLQPGYYADAQRYPFQDAGRNALDFTNLTLQRGCNQVTGWFAVDKIEYVNGQPSALDMRFEQHCEGNTPALHGQIHWVFDLTPLPPPGPITPPANAWKADPSLIPASGNYVYFESDRGNYVGDFFLQPTSRLYTDTDSIISINKQNSMANRLTVAIRGDLWWDGDFQTKASQARLEVGYYYGGLPGPPFDAERGGLNWSGDARSGGGSKSWFIVDKVVYQGDTLVAIDLRFTQRGDMGNNELRGQLHWSAAEKTPPPAPVYPVPSTLWQPPPSSLPATGNYTYLQSDAGDYIGAGATLLYTPPRGEISVYQHDWMAGIEVRAGESDLWIGMFIPPENMALLRPGYYAGLIGAPVNNPAKGGLSWEGFGRACNGLTGWFAVDRVLYDANVIVAVDLRFEQHCEGQAPAIRGAIHWVK